MKAREIFNTGGSGARRRGSALLLVMVMMGFLSMLVMTVIELLSADMDEEIARGAREEARLLALSGLAFGMHPQVKFNDPLLRRKTGEDEGFEVTVISEQAFLNIRYILDQEDREVLEKLFTEWGLKGSEIDPIIDALLDWVDDDELARLNGAELQDYEAEGRLPVPPNRSLVEVGELRFVRGVDRLFEVKPDWMDYFTVYGDGKLNVNDADKELIKVACELGDPQADQIEDYRNGPDMEFHTEDDRRFADLDEFMQAAGVGYLDAAVKARLTVESGYNRVISVGRVGEHTATLRVVVNSQQVTGEYLEWRLE